MGIDFDELGPAAQEALASMPLNEQAFVKHYAEHGNATAAYKAGWPNSNDNTAGKGGNLLLKKPRVATVLEEIKLFFAKRFEVTEDRILKAYAHLAFSDVRDFYDAEGALRRVPDLPRHLADMVQSFEVEEIWVGSGENRITIGQTKKVRLINRKDALDSLARTQGLFIAAPKDKGKSAKVVRFPVAVSRDDWEAKHGEKKG
jgi:phage terminase small subunit